MKTLPDKQKKDLTKRLSKSKLNNFVMCPKQFWFQQYYPEYNKGSLAMTRGKELHDILEHVFKLTGIREIKDKKELFIKVMRLTNAKKYQKEIKLFCDWQEENGFIIPESCEEKIYDKELDMVAIWDRVDYDKGKRTLTDYKTGKLHPIKQFKDELLFYAYIYMKHKKLRIDYVGIYFVDHKKFVHFEITKELIQEMLVKYIMENKDEMKDMQINGIWPCKKSFICPPNKAGTYDGCPWKEFCTGYCRK